MTRTPIDLQGPTAPLDTGLSKAELEAVLGPALGSLLPPALFEARIVSVQPFPPCPRIFYLDFVYGGVAPCVYGGPDSGDPSEKP